MKRITYNFLVIAAIFGALVGVRSVHAQEEVIPQDGQQNPPQEAQGRPAAGGAMGGAVSAKQVGGRMASHLRGAMDASSSPKEMRGEMRGMNERMGEKIGKGPKSGHDDASSTSFSSGPMMGIMSGEKEQRPLGQGIRDTRIRNAVTKAGAEVDQRVAALQGLLNRVNAMTNVSDAEKAALTNEVQAEITALTNLKGQVGQDAQLLASSTGPVASSSLSADIQSITKSNRVYALVIPKAQINVAADRASTVYATLTTLSTKLASRITQAQSAGKDVTAAQTALTDLNAKLADAQTQIQSAKSAVANLTPDNGNADAQTANAAALKSGRSYLQKAQADFQAAQKDAKVIVKAIQATHLDGTGTSTPMVPPAPPTSSETPAPTSSPVSAPAPIQ